MTAPDTKPQDATQLWREALEVMGVEVVGDGLKHPIVFGDGSPLPICRFLDDDWGLFGLAVEWIEARGEWFVEICSTRVGRYDGPSQWHFVADTRPITSGWLSASADTLPTAAARWIVEHGAPIRE